MVVVKRIFQRTNDHTVICLKAEKLSVVKFSFPSQTKPWLLPLRSIVLKVLKIVPRIYKGWLEFNNKKQTTLLKNGQRTWIYISLKITDGQYLCMALLGYRHKGPRAFPNSEFSMVPTDSTPALISGPEARPTCTGSSPRVHRADRKCRNYQALPSEARVPLDQSCLWAHAPPPHSWGTKEWEELAACSLTSFSWPPLTH